MAATVPIIGVNCIVNCIAANTKSWTGYATNLCVAGHKSPCTLFIKWSRNASSYQNGRMMCMRSNRWQEPKCDICEGGIYFQLQEHYFAKHFYILTTNWYAYTRQQCLSILTTWNVAILFDKKCAGRFATDCALKFSFKTARALSSRCSVEHNRWFNERTYCSLIPRSSLIGCVPDCIEKKEFQPFCSAHYKFCSEILVPLNKIK